MALTPQIEQLKSSGVYSQVFDKSQQIVSNSVTNRLVVGFSKKGPFNTPIYVPDTTSFIEIFGSIDKNLERKKSYFHRTALTALSRGPIVALNLLRLDDANDKAESLIFSTSATEENIGLVNEKFSGYYNTEKFWYPESDSFLANISGETTSNRLFNLVNLSQKPVSVIVIKTPTEDLTGFNMTVKEWFGSNNIPDYLVADDLISDFFIDVIVIGGDFGPKGTTAPYDRFSTDPVFSKYFDKVKGIKRRKVASDIRDTSLAEFLNLPEVDNTAFFRGCLLPDFTDKNGNDLFIENVINYNVAKTGLYCAINKDIFADGETLSGVLGGLDLIGHSIEFERPTQVNFLSYSETVKTDIDYSNSLPTLQTLDLTSVTIEDNTAGNAVFIVPVSNTASFVLANTLVSNTLTPRVVGSYVKSAKSNPLNDTFGAVINVIKSATNVYFEVSGLTSADFQVGTTEIDFINPTEIDFVNDGTFTIGLDTYGKIIGSLNSTLYQDSLNGVITNGDKIYYGLNGTIPGYLAFEFKTNYDQMQYGSDLILPIVGNYKLPIVNVTAYTTADMTELISTFGFSLTYYDSLGVAAATDTLLVQTLKGSLNSTIIVTPTTLSNEVDISSTEISKVVVGDYIVADDGSLTSKSRLTKISKIVKIGSTYRLTTYSPMEIKDVEGVYTISSYKPVTSWCDYYTIFSMKGFVHNAYHLPDGTNDQQNNILYDTLNGTALYDALIDRENISLRYIVDTWGNGIETNSKAILANMAKDRGDCFAILNAPSMKEFKDSMNPSFTGLKGNVEARYITEGGDLSKNPDFIYSLPTISQGSNFCAFYGPYIKIRENGKTITVPPAGFVCNLFIDKLVSSYAWSLVAGPRRGIIAGGNVVGVETSLSKGDRDYLEPFGYNPIIFQPGEGVMIYGDKTAQQNVKSALSEAHVREALIFIQIELENVLRNFVFEFNTSDNRSRIKFLADTVLKRVRSADGIYDFRTQMDESNNTTEVIDKNIGILDTWVEPIKGMNILVSKIQILRTGSIKVGAF